MMKSKQIKPPLIQVRGRFLKPSANDDVVHRTYQYHVHIEDKDASTATDYDRALNIKSLPPDEPSEQTKGHIKRHIKADTPSDTINDKPVHVSIEPDDDIGNKRHEPLPSAIGAPTGDDFKASESGEKTNNSLLHKINLQPHLKQSEEQLQQILQPCRYAAKKYLRQWIQQVKRRMTGKMLASSLGMLLAIFLIYIFYKPGESVPYTPPGITTRPSNSTGLNGKRQTIAIPLQVPGQGLFEPFPIDESGEAYTVVQQHEVIHTVIRGNTLWFIAKRYVNNPLRYPELARLSDIKNPDLIYPGDRIRIFVAK